jgi:hypothetical protein
MVRDVFLEHLYFRFELRILRIEAFKLFDEILCDIMLGIAFFDFFIAFVIERCGTPDTRWSLPSPCALRARR